jgi:predicted O-methyltransferase YrrM
MGCWNYGKSLDWLDELKYNKENVGSLLKKYYPEIKDDVIHSGYFGTMDSVLLYCYIREYKPKNILEIGGGTSTKIMLQALTKNNENAKITCFALQRTSEDFKISEKIDYEFYAGDFMDTYYQNPIDLGKIDFIFIDGPHEAYFATFFCYEILDKLKNNTLIHIHDFQEPSVLREGYEKSWYVLGEYMKHPTITDEAYTVYFHLKNNTNYKLLCKSNDLLENNFNLVEFIENVSNCMYKNAFEKKGLFKQRKSRIKNETQASSIYLLKS